MSAPRIAAELRRLVRSRAGDRCEYCLVPSILCLLPHQVDHIIAQKHGGETTAENLALSCIICNQHKGSDLSSLDPRDGSLTPLYHPRRDRWSDHFALNGLLIVPRSAVGRVTVRLLQFNSPQRVTEREWFAATGKLIVPD